MIRIDEAIITDANILIDFCKLNKEIIRTLCQELKKVTVPLLVLQEVDELDCREAEGLGITVIDSDLEILEKAFGLMNGLSYQDNLCLITASRENLTCVTNDKRLKKECRDRGIRSLWGLELVLLLFQRKRITKKEARKLLTELVTINNRITKTVFLEFERQLEKISAEIFP